MNNLEGRNGRRRGQTLLIVEGNHEKNELFHTIFNSFQELSIQMSDVWIYGTNIYQLYDLIAKEYGEHWYNDDIDLPLLVSEKIGIEKKYKDDFKNIFLVFDYERHDPNFSEEKIMNMQKYFADATDAGMLYINYPMIESYQHLRSLDDPEYMERNIPVTLQLGKKYKALVRDSFMNIAMSYPKKLHDVLVDRFEVADNEKLNTSVERILAIINLGESIEQIKQILSEIVDADNLSTAVYQIMDTANKVGYADKNINYWEYMRSMFQQIICINIRKAYAIQKGEVSKMESDIKDVYSNYDAEKILSIQNKVSSDINDGFIWVLSTCIMLVAEYNIKLLDN